MYGCCTESSVRVVVLFSEGSNSGLKKLVGFGAQYLSERMTFMGDVGLNR